MSTSNPKVSVELDISRMDDAELTALIAVIQKVAPTSALLQDSAVKASFAALGTKASSFSTAFSAVRVDEQQLETDKQVLEAARTTVKAELGALRTLVARDATTAQDVSGMGFTPLTRTAPSRTTPPVPATVIAVPEKAHGRARATVVLPRGARATFVAESSPDPLGPSSVWTPLPGNGKQRTVTGPSGSRVWIRFAQVRFGLQSDWSTPVLVTLP
jgi:hypothetical protein